MEKKKVKVYFYIRTFGCQMNFHDSEKISGVLARSGFSEVSDEDKDRADIIVFNTCSIRQKAEQKFFSELGRLKKLKRQRPGLKIAVAGCVAQQMGRELLRKAPFVDCIVGPQNIHSLGRIFSGPEGVSCRACAGGEARLDRDVLIDENHQLASIELPAARKKKPGAWVSIMYGCNNFCTYCIVPFTRGREVCRPSGSILDEIRRLAEEGFREVTLLGQNVNSYRNPAPGGVDFPGLLEMADRIDGISRIRFVTSHPRDLSEGLIEAIGGLEKLCEHVHLPLQSGSDAVLARMNRRYSFADYMGRIERLRRRVPGISITTDIIAGFPGETEEDHEATMTALRRIEFDGIFAFKYSPRPGTAASKFSGHLPDDVSARRLDEILALQDDITLEKNRALVGTTEEVMVEGADEKNADEKNKDRLAGRTRTNKTVNFFSAVPSGGADLSPGALVSLEIIKARRHSLEGELRVLEGELRAPGGETVSRANGGKTKKR
ncbi:MAG: tRNA (N6-isopentenyl adenosine(37)-C2)-methylthiotransferase MiaB [Nitrospiraceae bacterium]|nr:tRNA (N6-isopentenyl adenosine(37)-C2)-methylthiotransferase MiaB [Nitrospiraceae bacterium]